MDPLTAYRQKQQQQQQRKKKKPNYLGVYVAVGAIILLGLLIFWVSRDTGPRKTTPSRPPAAPEVSVAESQRRKVYAQLFRYADMLTSRGGSRADAYRVVADLNKVSISVVQQIEAEGNSKRWPRE